MGVHEGEKRKNVSDADWRISVHLTSRHSAPPSRHELQNEMASINSTPFAFHSVLEKLKPFHPSSKTTLPPSIYLNS